MAEQTVTKAPPYVSFLTFNTLLDWLRDLGTIPSQFDRSFWSQKFSGSSGAQLMTGLRFLGLLDSDEPQERLELLAMAREGERKAQLAQLLRDAYGADFVDGLPRMTPKMVADRIASLGATGATQRKAVSFFVNAAKAADVPMPGNIAKQARNKPGTETVRRPRRVPARQDVRQANDIPQTPRDLPSGENVSLPTQLHKALVPLVEDLAKIGLTWDKPSKARWLTAFTTMLDYSYPVQGNARDVAEPQ